MLNRLFVLIFMLALTAFSSCTIQKRHYSKGFYVSWNKYQSAHTSPMESFDTLTLVGKSETTLEPNSHIWKTSPIIENQERKKNDEITSETKNHREVHEHLKKETKSIHVERQQPKNSKYEKQLKYSSWLALSSLALFMLTALIFGESTSIFLLIALSIFFLAFFASLIAILWFLLLRSLKKPAINSDQADELKLKSSELENQISRIRKKTLWILGISLFCGLSSASGLYFMLLLAMIGLFVGFAFLMSWFIKALTWKSYAKKLNDFDATRLTPKQMGMLNRTFAQWFYKISLDAILPLGLLSGIILWFHYILTN